MGFWERRRYEMRDPRGLMRFFQKNIVQKTDLGRYFSSLV